MKHCDGLPRDYKHGKGLSESLKETVFALDRRINTCTLPRANVLFGRNKES
jgi:hypothetical protein